LRIIICSVVLCNLPGKSCAPPNSKSPLPKEGTPYSLEITALREEHRLRVRTEGLRRIFGPKRIKVVGSWRKLQN